MAATDIVTAFLRLVERLEPEMPAAKISDLEWKIRAEFGGANAYVKKTARARVDSTPRRRSREVLARPPPMTFSVFSRQSVHET